MYVYVSRFGCVCVCVVCVWRAWLCACVHICAWLMKTDSRSPYEDFYFTVLFDRCLMDIYSISQYFLFSRMQLLK